MKIYAIYKGEKFLCEGTSKECADYLGVKVDTVRWWNSPANKKRATGKRKSGKDIQRTFAILIEEN